MVEKLDLKRGRTSWLNPQHLGRSRVPMLRALRMPGPAIWPTDQMLHSGQHNAFTDGVETTVVPLTFGVRW
jgi:hypothetical protein